MNDIFLVLGASSDVGIELIKKLNSSMERIIIIAHYNSSFETLSTIKAINGNKIIIMKCDLREPEAVDSFADNVKKIGIPKGIVHLPAPKLEYVAFKDIQWQDCASDIEIQVRSIFLILQSLLPKMVKTESMSKVVFMLSENTIHEPAKFSTKYTMSKYMLLGLMKSLTAEYAGKSVNINALSPAMIDTKLLSNIDRRMLEVFGATNNMLQAKDIIGPIVSLLSKESDEMYGENILLTERIHDAEQ